MIELTNTTHMNDIEEIEEELTNDDLLALDELLVHDDEYSDEDDEELALAKKFGF